MASLLTSAHTLTQYSQAYILVTNLVSCHTNLEFQLDFVALERAKAQFEIQPLEDADNTFHFSPEAIDCSHYAFETIMALCGEVEDAHNACEFVPCFSVPR